MSIFLLATNSTLSKNITLIKIKCGWGESAVLTVYYANHLEVQKEILIHLLTQQPLSNPLQAEQIVVQSQGMAQWLKLEIAQQQGILANVRFPLPASFIWNQYHRFLPQVPEHNAYQKHQLVWHLMAIIPELIEQPVFNSLKNYLTHDPTQQKLFQLSQQIADLFDQYLIYRPEWILAWQQQQEDTIIQQLMTANHAMDEENIRTLVQWQGILWRQLVARITQQTGTDKPLHRVTLQQEYLALLANQKPHHFPERIFVFGISALPHAYMQILHAMAQHCEVHLFFNNPCQYYWGDILAPSVLKKIALTQRLHYQTKAPRQWLNPTQQQWLNQSEISDIQYLQETHPLLATWGKMGRDFLALLSQVETQQIDAYAAAQGSHLLAQLQNSFLNLQATQETEKCFSVKPEDDSLRIVACYSEMREVEQLQQQLLTWLQQDESLTIRDIVVMLPDIDRYAPYIHAVFSQYDPQDKRYIPYTISDRKLTHSDRLIATFMQLLQMKEANFEVESLLSLFDIPEVSARFDLSVEDLPLLKQWIIESNIRYGLQTNDQENPNAWQAGVARLLLGSALRQVDGEWQGIIAFDKSYGLSAVLAGKLAEFIERLSEWHQIIQSAYSIQQWQSHLHWLIDQFFASLPESQQVLVHLKTEVTAILQQATETGYSQSIGIEIVSQWLQEQLNEQAEPVNFLTGKLNFCTLLPMRTIPFRVVALLGMNEADYPRQHQPNSFDLMQYHSQKGDRNRRDDERYLFMEALLSAQDKCYISYIGRSLTKEAELPPSVLVSQLLDYLEQHTQMISELVEDEDCKDKVRSYLLHSQAMTIFSESNFQGHQPSFAHEWLSATQPTVAYKKSFVQPLNHQESSELVTITLADLVSFLVDPVKYFFESQLGANFTITSDELPKSERFTLDNLVRYQIGTQLLSTEPHLWEGYLNALQKNGTLPRAYFGQIVQQQLIQDFSALATAIALYRQQIPNGKLIEYPFKKDQKECFLSANIDALYDGQLVMWRAGRIRLYDQLTLWISYLLLQSQQESPVASPYFYGVSPSGILEKISFEPLSQTEATAMLSLYLTDFLASRTQLFLIPSQHYQAFLADKTTDEKKRDLILSFCERENDYNKHHPYWTRVLSSIDVDQELDMGKTTTKIAEWFGLMSEKIAE